MGQTHARREEENQNGLLYTIVSRWRICASINKANIISDNGLSPARRHIIVNWNLGNTFQEHFNQHQKIATIMSWLQSVTNVNCTEGTRVILNTVFENTVYEIRQKIREGAHMAYIRYVSQDGMLFLY